MLQEEKTCIFAVAVVLVFLGGYLYHDYNDGLTQRWNRPDISDAEFLAAGSSMRHMTFNMPVLTLDTLDKLTGTQPVSASSTLHVSGNNIYDVTLSDGKKLTVEVIGELVRISTIVQTTRPSSAKTGSTGSSRM